MTSLDGPPLAELGISYSSATQGHSALTNSTDGTKGTGTFAAVDTTPNQSSQVGQGTRNSSSAAPEHPTVTGTNSTGHESNPKNSHIVSDTYNHQKRRTLVMIPGICMVICFLGFIITVSSGMMQTEPELTWSLLGSFVLFLLILVVLALRWTRKE
ncbi:Protein of unknown function [Pyronema omphalodes CBS 100304]|uniref:Uncharacterized protein n=1 Tax=Pyronema omphalodes (strain CBS 100304) TaxID=1076935 RepID=U4LCJ3_PYROM|nr:Protein of unknown function [Pyronema omphalodes CBS 100304]